MLYTGKYNAVLPGIRIRCTGNIVRPDICICFTGDIGRPGILYAIQVILCDQVYAIQIILCNPD